MLWEAPIGFVDAWGIKEGRWLPVFTVGFIGFWCCWLTNIHDRLLLGLAMGCIAGGDNGFLSIIG